MYVAIAAVSGTMVLQYFVVNVMRAFRALTEADAADTPYLAIGMSF